MLMNTGWACLKKNGNQEQRFNFTTDLNIHKSMCYKSTYLDTLSIPIPQNA
jgi:hypothetical protein